MLNNGQALVPEWWLQSFDEFDHAQLNLQTKVSRNVESVLGDVGDTVNVPIPEDATEAAEWDGVSTASDDTINQVVNKVVLEKSFVKKFNLTSKDLSRNPYDLIKEFGIPRAEGILLSVNKYIANKLLASPYFIDGRSAFTEDTLTDARTMLTNNRASLSGRNAIMSPTDSGVLLKRDAFKLALNAGSPDAQNLGKLGMKSGLDIAENNALETYTPADIAGTVNGALTSGATSANVAGFADSAKPIKEGDIFTFAGETGTPLHTVVATTRTAGNTTAIVFSPAIVSNVADASVINVIPTRSVLAFTPNAVAFAARTYANMPDGTGIKTTTAIVQGIPIRISIMGTPNVGVSVQMDTLVGANLIKATRCARILR